MLPVEAFKERPVGRLPLSSEKLYGADPPDTESTVLYGSPLTAGVKVPLIVITETWLGLMLVAAVRVGLKP